LDLQLTCIAIATCKKIYLGRSMMTTRMMINIIQSWPTISEVTYRATAGQQYFQGMMKSSKRPPTKL